MKVKSEDNNNSEHKIHNTIQTNTTHIKYTKVNKRSVITITQWNIIIITIMKIDSKNT